MFNKRYKSRDRHAGCQECSQAGRGDGCLSPGVLGGADWNRRCLQKYGGKIDSTISIKLMARSPELQMLHAVQNK